MFIIGHRGAAGLAPENTLPSIEAALSCKVDMIEIDIRVTKDKHLVIFHDASLSRIAGIPDKISNLTLDEINTTITRSGHPIPLLREVIEAASKTPLLLDCKGKGWANLLVKELEKHKDLKVAVTARDHQELFLFSQLKPDIETYVSEYMRPFDAIYKARLLDLTGVSLNFWVLSPLSYFWARHYKLKFMIFTVNSSLLARFLHFFYPHAAIITNVPDKLAKLSNRQTEKSKGKT